MADPYRNPISLKLLNGSGWRTSFQDKILGTIDDDSVRERVNEIILEEITPYVPMGGNSPMEAFDPDPHPGNLREDVTVTDGSITWNADYAHYQYQGWVYGVNYKIYTNRNEDGSPDKSGPYKYRSARGVRKFKTWRHLTYYTPGTGKHWWSLLRKAKGAHLNRRISQYLVREMKRRGL